jgi:putative nucleotidyltransferase with HDIG domain
MSHDLPDLWIVNDTPTKAAAIRRQLDEVFALHLVALARIGATEPPPHLLIDVEFANGTLVAALKEWLGRKPKDCKVIVAVDKASHFQAIQAKALGATAVVQRPLQRKPLVTALLGDLASMADDNPAVSIKTSPGVAQAFDALRNVFETACLGVQLDPVAINSGGEAVMRRMEAQGLGSWLDTVRKHHSQTYQHCLIVTGVTVAFSQHLGLSRPDQLRLAFGAMLHDIGKARIPIEILEKPAAPTADEMALLRKHPEYGFEALKSSSEVSPEVLDLVVHHHEYIDGSGYPHGLGGSEIADPVRIMTICDIFGALIERRAYKPPLAPEVAYQMLLDMGDKLDRDLVRAFGFVKTLRLNAAA